MRLFRSLFSIFIVALFTFQSVAQAYAPTALYDDVWKLINARFVDGSQNGQDWRIWRNRYDDQLETEDDAYVAIMTMLASLDDRYTRFLDPEEFSEENRSIKAKLFGIGIQIGNRDDKLLIIAPIEDTPAFNGGLKADDEIIKIDDVEAKGMNVRDAAKLIRGEKGTTVTLLIRRENKDDKPYIITRDEINLKAVADKPPFETDIPKNIGYIKISTFLSSRTFAEFKTFLEAKEDKDGFIVDLRSNPGGLLSNAVNIADIFLDGGGIVSTVERDGYKEVKRSSRQTLTDKPVVILIDRGSASASEILSGALRDNNRAILVGRRSFGKGLVQEINRLPGGGGVNITTQRYLTPNDTDINKTGIHPDIEVEVTEEDIEEKNDPQLKAALVVMEDWLGGKSMKLLQSRSLLKQSQLASESETEEEKPAGPIGF